MGVLGGGFIGGGFVNAGSSGGGGGGPPSGPAGGIDISGTYPSALNVIGLRGVAISATAPVAGQVLTFNGAQWVPTAPSSGLPSQAGNAGRVLVTDGSNPSWTDVLADVSLEGVGGDVFLQSATNNVQVYAPAGGLRVSAFDAQFEVTDFLITALGGLVGTFGDAISLNTSSGTAELSGTGTATLASVGADVQISADTDIVLSTAGGIVSVPDRTAGDATQAAANTGFVDAAIAAAVAALAPRLYTRVEVNTPFAIGSAPTYSAILTLPIAAGTRVLLDGYIHLSGGTAAAPTSGAITFGGVSTISARRPTTGAPTVSGTPAVVSGTIAALAAQAVISGNNLVIQARATGGPSVTAVFFYRVEVLATPA